MKPTIIPKDKLSTIREQLPYGSGKKIAQKIGCSQARVYRVLNGLTNYPPVIEAALEIIKENKMLVSKVDLVLEDNL